MVEDSSNSGASQQNRRDDRRLRLEVVGDEGWGMSTPTPLKERRERLSHYLETTDLEAVWFAQPNSFGWLTGGSNVVDRDSLGVAAVGFDSDEEFQVATNSIEAERLAAEELPAEIEVAAVDWYTDSLTEAVAEQSPMPAAADFDVPEFEQINPTPLRQPLAAEDIDRYRSLATEVTAELNSVCRSLSADETEQAVAAELRGGLEHRGIAAPVVLVGGSERAQQYRHYTPTTATLGAYALVSVTAQRGGLYVSATRTVAFDPPGWLQTRHRTAAQIEVTALAATQQVAADDGTAGEVFGAIQEAYAASGRAEEWRHHHQGGAAGFAGREWIATPDSTERVFAPMAYAWNPTVQGAKSEGTVVVSEDEIEPLTVVEEWPTIAVSAHSGIDALESDAGVTLSRPAILEL